MAKPQPEAVELNRVTPRIFVAATRQDDGKTTTCLALLSILRERFSKVGYTKPIGQRTVDVGGMQIDEDSVLVNETYKPGLPLEAMSPIAVVPRFTRDYLDNPDPHALQSRVLSAFNRAAWEQEFVVIEGTGHAGVGSVFDMSNAQVAALLESRVVIVSQGGLGKPLDEISLNLALFQKHGVDVAGVILNKVVEEKIPQLLPYAEKGLARMGLPLLGIVPLRSELRKPTINQVREELSGNWVAGQKFTRRRINRIVIGTASSRNADIYIEPDSLIITAGDREDLILAILGACGEEGGTQIAGVVLAQGFLPQPGLIKIMQSKNIPFISVDYDSYTVASRINKMSVKTEPGDRQKIELIQNLFHTHVDMQSVLQAAQRGKQLD